MQVYSTARYVETAYTESKYVETAYTKFKIQSQVLLTLLSAGKKNIKNWRAPHIKTNE